MAKSRELKVVLSGDPRGLQRAFGAVEGAGGKAFKALAHGAGIAAIAVGGAFVVGATKAVGAASDLGEEVNKSGIIFGKARKDMLSWSEGAATAFGLSQRAALEASSNFGGFFKVAGQTEGNAAKLSKRMVELAGDMASFNNSSPEDTLDALRSGLSGESEPLRKFRVFLNEAKVAQEAVNMGIAKQGEKLTDGQKILARYNIIVRETKDAHGDYARTSSGLANVQRTLRAQIEDVGASFGKSLLPQAEKATNFLSKEVVPKIKDVADKIGDVFARDDLSLGEKFARSFRIGNRRLKPLEDDFVAALKNAHLDTKLAHAFEGAAPKVADALAKSAPRAAGAFVHSFMDAGIWGQLLTLAFLQKKLGIFSPLGRWAGGQFGTSFGPTAAGASGAAMKKQGGKFRTMGRGMGTGILVGADAAIAGWTIGTLLRDHVPAVKSAGDFIGRQLGEAIFGGNEWDERVQEWGDQLNDAIQKFKTTLPNALEGVDTVVNKALRDALPAPKPTGPRVPKKPAHTLSTGGVHTMLPGSIIASAARAGVVAHGSKIVPIGGGEEADDSIVGLINTARGRFGSVVTDAFDRDRSAGHKSPGHNVTGTAVDFAGGNLMALTDWAISQGYYTIYNGNPRAHHLAGHDTHAHIEFGSRGASGGTTSAPRRSTKPPTVKVPRLSDAWIDRHYSERQGRKVLSKKDALRIYGSPTRKTDWSPLVQLGLDQIDLNVHAGRMTSEAGDAAKRRILTGALPFLTGNARLEAEGTLHDINSGNPLMDGGKHEDDAPDEPTFFEQLTSGLSDLDLQVRAGDLTEEKARSIAVDRIRSNLGNPGLSEHDRLELRAQLGDLLKEQTQATSDLTEQIKALTAEMTKTNDHADRVNAVSLAAVWKALGDLMNEQAYAEYDARAKTAGDGSTYRF